MNIVALNDTHIRGAKPVARMETQAGWEAAVMGKLEFIFEFAEKNNAIVCHAGDLFHTPRDVTGLGLLAAAMANTCKHNIYAVTGQHDLYMRNQEALTNFRLMEDLGIVHNVGRGPITIHDGRLDGQVNIYGAGWGGDVPKTQRPQRGHNILLIHAPISTRPLYPGHEYTGASQFAKKHAQEYDLIICGDCHVPFYEHVPKNNHHDCHIVNSGPMLRLDASQDSVDLKPGFWFIQTTGGIQVERITIPHKPADYTITRDHLDRQETAKAKMEQFVAAMKQENKMEPVNIVAEVRKAAQDISDGAQRILGIVMEETDDN